MSDNGDEATSWKVHTAIGEATDGNGNFTGVNNGRMTAPQNQTAAGFDPATATPVVVALLEDVSCAVEVATDTDKKTVTRDGAVVSTTYPPDEVKYEWTAERLDNTETLTSTGTFADPTQRETTWKAPNSNARFLLKCTIKDVAEKPATEGGKRDDADVVRKVIVTVVQVNFKLTRQEIEKIKYGFDNKAPNNIQPWGSVAVGDTSQVYAEILPGTLADPKAVHFGTKQIDPVMSPSARITVAPQAAAEHQGDKWSQLLEIGGVEVGDKALVKADDSKLTDPNFGEMRVSVHNKRKLRIAIAPVSDTSGNINAPTNWNFEAIKWKLIQVYKQAVIEVEVKLLNPGTVTFDGVGNGLEDGALDAGTPPANKDDECDLGLIIHNTDEQKAIMNAFAPLIARGDYDKIVFITGKSNLPFYRGIAEVKEQPYSFIFPDVAGADTAKTVAHELGHSLALEHTQQLDHCGKLIGAVVDKDNIMHPYVTADIWCLRKYQWDRLNPPVKNTTQPPGE